MISLWAMGLIKVLRTDYVCVFCQHEKLVSALCCCDVRRGWGANLEWCAELEARSGNFAPGTPRVSQLQRSLSSESCLTSDNTHTLKHIPF